jgi:integrase
MRGFLEDRSPGWRNPKHRQQWENTLATYAVPEIGNLFVRDVELAHILNILRPLWTTKTETASRLRGRLENVLDWAKVHGYREGENPARWKGNLDMVLPAPSKTKNVKHHNALPFSQVGVFMVDLRKRSGVAAKALEFAILTAARSGEVRGATWQEINLEKAEWTVPSERMKARREHRIPLPPQVIELLKGIPQGEANEIVFKAPRGGMLSDMSLGAVLKRMEVPVTVHGFRSTFRDWAGETTAFPREVTEHALAHQLQDKAEAAYARGTLLVKRRKLMEAWATYCSQRTSVLADILQMSG